MVLRLLNYFGSSMLVILISYIIVDTMHSKHLNYKGIVGRVILLIILFIGLLRT